jgi:hypothetical protein
MTYDNKYDFLFMNVLFYYMLLYLIVLVYYKWNFKWGMCFHYNYMIIEELAVTHWIIYC